MPEPGFLKNSSCDPGAPAVYDATSHQWFTRAHLSARLEAFAATLNFRQKALGFCFVFNDVESLIAYQAAIAVGHAIVMLNPEMDGALKTRLIARFQPDFIVAPQSHPPECIWLQNGAYSITATPHPRQLLLRASSPHRQPLHPDLTFLNSTSGSTGSPKLVRLTWRNLEVNAAQINHLLRSSDRDRTILTAPMFNGYGQSAIHTMLQVGGSFVLTRDRLVSREYWETVRETECTAIGGTSYFYQVLDRLDLDALNVPKLSKFAHSGDRLAEHLIQTFHRAAERRGGTLHLMYGQAETTARMSGLPPERLHEAIRSVGFAVPGGRFRVEQDGRPCAPGQEGELIFEGPNVMMGYATSREDLAKGDELGGVRATGDLGYLDERGLAFLTGRKARFVKVFGWRVSLDDVEQLLSHTGPVAAVNQQERIVIYTESAGPELEVAVKELAARLNLHPAGFEVRALASIPRLANNKVDYGSLTRNEAARLQTVTASGAGAAYRLLPGE